MQISSQTEIKKIPTLYIGENFYVTLGIDLKTLRLEKRITLNDLSKTLNISTTTLRNLEKGKLRKAYNFIHIYCRHFSVNPNQFIKKYNLECNTLNDKLEYLKLYYGIKSFKKLDPIIGTYVGGISDYITRNRNKGVEQLIDDRYQEIKKK
ncbi:helix-turn-helix domain-containing protein [Clostridium tertium]